MGSHGETLGGFAKGSQPSGICWERCHQRIFELSTFLLLVATSKVEVQAAATAYKPSPSPQGTDKTAQPRASRGTGPRPSTCNRRPAQVGTVGVAHWPRAFHGWLRKSLQTSSRRGWKGMPLSWVPAPGGAQCVCGGPWPPLM
ncbi:uncharacterized protein RHO17_016121 [Thomomys bottae]